MIYACFEHQQGPEPFITYAERNGNFPSEPSPTYTPELAVNQDDLPPVGYARSFEMQKDEVNEAPHRPEQEEPFYFD